MLPALKSLENSPSLPTPKNVARAVNNNRKKLRPAETLTLQFEIDTGYVNGLLQAHCWAKERSHLIIAGGRE